VSPETQITNLLYRYAECIDTGDLAGAASLFEHAVIRVGAGEAGTMDAGGLLKFLTKMVILYPDGTPRTRHLTTNPIVEVDEHAGTATCRSYYTVLQQTDDFPLQPIVAGRYHDRFERLDRRWRFSYRDYTMMELIGDLSHHLAQPMFG
jgi:3-phenylpropionate/cinnamic acid dioxygenase small subunit